MNPEQWARVFEAGARALSHSDVAGTPRSALVEAFDAMGRECDRIAHGTVPEPGTPYPGEPLGKCVKCERPAVLRRVGGIDVPVHTETGAIPCPPRGEVAATRVDPSCCAGWFHTLGLAHDPNCPTLLDPSDRNGEAVVGKFVDRDHYPRWND